jgi:hypothetical protein
VKACGVLERQGLGAHANKPCEAAIDSKRRVSKSIGGGEFKIAAAQEELSGRGILVAMVDAGGVVDLIHSLKPFFNSIK